MNSNIKLKYTLAKGISIQEEIYIINLVLKVDVKFLQSCLVNIQRLKIKYKLKESYKEYPKIKI